MLAERTDARITLSAYEAETQRLQEKALLAEQNLEVLYQMRNEAAWKAEAEVQSTLEWMVAMQHPFEDELAFATDSYLEFRLPYLLKIAVDGDRENPEFPQTEKLAAMCCRVTGFRTCRKCGGDEDMPNDRSLMLAAYDEYRDQVREKAVVQPSARDVLDAQETKLRRQFEEHYHNEKVEDLRNVKLPPKHNVIVPPAKRTQNLSELFRP